LIAIRYPVRDQSHSEVHDVLRLEPTLYWLPSVNWVIEENKARMLRHIRLLSERLVRSVN